jgi:hypothetical protein
MDLVGRYAYMVGILLPFILGLVYGLMVTVDVPAWLYSVMAVAGLIIGGLNVQTKNAVLFLVTTGFLSLIGIVGLTANLNVPMVLGNVIESVGGLLLATLAPAFVVVAIKSAVVTTRK